jgi:hypothetical protein
MISASWLSRVVILGAETRLVVEDSFRMSRATLNSWNESFPNV